MTAQNQFHFADASTRRVSILPASRPDHGVSFGITKSLLLDLIFAKHFAHPDGIDNVFHGSALYVGRRKTYAPCEGYAGKLRSQPFVRDLGIHKTEDEQGASSAN